MWYNIFRRFFSPPGISKLIGYLFNFQINAYLKLLIGLF